MILSKTFREKTSLFILVCSVFFVISFFSTASPVGANPMDIALPNDAGEKIRLGQVAAGKPLLLYFWATWCKPCRWTRPKVSEFAKKYKDQVKVLGINLGGLDSIEDVRKYRSRYKITYPLLFDRDNETADAYSVFVIPAVILLDGAGDVRYRGDSPPANLEDFLAK